MLLTARHLIAGLILAATVARAQTIVSYTFGTTGSPVTSANTVASNVSASSFSSFTGSGANGTSTGSATAGGSGGAYFTASNFRTSDNNYFSFTLTPTAGYQVTLTSVSFYYASSSTGPTSSLVQSSADSYGSNLASFTLTPAAGTITAADWHQSSSSITLSFTSATTFHITGSGAAGSTGAFRIDDVTLLGSVSLVAVPEPAETALFAGFAALGAAWYRRRRKPKS